MKSFNEIGQFIHTSRTTFKPPNSAKKIDYKGEPVSKILTSWTFDDVFPLCSKLRQWQDKVFKSLDTNDMYIAASPSAGKTLPYICYWAKQTLRLSLEKNSNVTFTKYLDNLYILLTEPEKIAKLVVLVPIRALADQTSDEFRKIFSNILASYIEKVLNLIINVRPFSDKVINLSLIHI